MTVLVPLEINDSFRPNLRRFGHVIDLEFFRETRFL
jgi:hypothetical protein